jgi:solute:Na+ symporter, SSS family
LLGWAAGILWGTWTAWNNGVKPLASIAIGDVNYQFYVGLGALILNIAIAAIATMVIGLFSKSGDRAATARS